MQLSRKRVLTIAGGAVGGALAVCGLVLGYPLAVTLGLAWVLGTWGIEGYEMMWFARSARVRDIALGALGVAGLIYIALVVLLVATGAWESPHDWLRKHPSRV